MTELVIEWLEQVTKLKRDCNLPQPPKLFKRFQKNIVLAYIYQLTKFGGLVSCDSKDIFKNTPCLMY